MQKIIQLHTNYVFQVTATLSTNPFPNLLPGLNHGVVLNLTPHYHWKPVLRTNIINNKATSKRGAKSVLQMIHYPEVPSVFRIIHCAEITTQQRQRLVYMNIRQWKLRAFWYRTYALFSDGVPSDDIHVIIKRWKIFAGNLTLKTFQCALANNGNNHF